MSVQIPGLTPIIIEEEAYPGEPLRPGDSNQYVLNVKNALNTISVNFPEIPRIYPVDTTYDTSLEDAVKKFQEIFNIPITGIIDKATWYEIRKIYDAVRRLSTSTSEVILPIEIYEEVVPEAGVDEVFPTVQLAQYFLNVLSAFFNAIPPVDINGMLDARTRSSIMEFQKTVELPATGIIDNVTWDLMYSYVLGILEVLPPSAIALPALLYPGINLSEGSQGANVLVIQLFLSYISSIILQIPFVNITGLFDPQTTAAVIAFQNIFSINPTGIIDEETWNKIVEIYRQLRFSSYRPIGQYPGTLIGD